MEYRANRYRTRATPLNKRLLDATSGNTGIAFAMSGRRPWIWRYALHAREYAPERKRILKAYGAEVVLTDLLESSDGAIRVARQLYVENPKRFYYAD